MRSYLAFVAVVCAVTSVACSGTATEFIAADGNVTLWPNVPTTLWNFTASENARVRSIVLNGASVCDESPAWRVLLAMSTDEGVVLSFELEVNASAHTSTSTDENFLLLPSELPLRKDTRYEFTLIVTSACVVELVDATLHVDKETAEPRMATASTGRRRQASASSSSSGEEPASDEDDSEWEWWETVLVVVGGIAGCCLLCGCCKKKRSRQAQQSRNEPISEARSSSSSAISISVQPEVDADAIDKILEWAHGAICG
jgi:hypothetical protein